MILSSVARMTVLFTALMISFTHTAQTEPINEKQAKDHQIVAQKTKTSTDEHTLKTETHGPIVDRILHDQIGVTYYSYFLRAFNDAGAQLYIVVKIASDGFLINQAHSRGTKLSVTRITVQDEFIGVSEHVAINLSRTELATLAKASTKFAVKLSGPKGSVVVEFEPSYLKGFYNSWSVSQGG